MQDANIKIEKYDIDKNPVIVLDANDWHHGVIGIVASRITEKYCRPSILVSFEGNDPTVVSDSDIGKGSGRSIKGMNLVDALCYCNDHLVKFGGHELAAGLSVTRKALDNFRKRINEYAINNLSETDMIPTVEVDCEIDFESATLALAESLQILEPYGVGNPVPVFVMRGVTVNEISGVSGGKHTKLVLGNGKYNLSAIYFSNSPSSLGIYVGDRIDILFNIDINEWAGRKNIQLIIRDFKSSLSQALEIEQERNRFEEIRMGAVINPGENVVPCREDFAAVYNLMRSAMRAGVYTMTHRDMISRLASPNWGVKIGYIKLKFIIMVLKELNLVTIEENEAEVYTFNIHYTSSKTDLDKSTLLRKLRLQMAKGR